MASSATKAARPIRNNTSFPVQTTARLQQLHARYLAATADAADPEHGWAGLLRYYQYTVRAIFSDPEFGLGSDAAGTATARGLLCYHSMGLGKTRLAVAVALALWDVRPVVVMLPRSLRPNFEKTVRDVLAATGDTPNPGGSPTGDTPNPGGRGAAPTDAQLAAALERFTFVSMDAYNAAEQMARAGTNQRKSASPSGLGLTGGLDNKLLIVDEAHNFFRAIINGGEDSNARRNYDLIMGARNLRILFLTGTPASKDPFELVPCFNMLAGFNLLPTQYETFYDLYVDKGANTVKNREHFANRIIGLVSHVSTALSTAPVDKTAADPMARSVVDQARAEGLLLSDEDSERPINTDTFIASAGCLYTPNGPDGCVVLYPPGSPRWQELESGKLLPPPETAFAYDIDKSRLLFLDSAAAVEKFSAEFGCVAEGFPAIDWARVAAVYPGVAFDPYDKAWVAPPSERAPTFWYHTLDAVNYFVWGPSVVRARKRLTVAPSKRARATRTDGWFPDEKPTIIERVEMGPDQYRRYLLARERENAEGGGGGGASGLGTVLASGPLSLPGAEKKAMRSYFVHSRSLENFAPPRGYDDTPIDSIPQAELTDSLAPKLALIARRATAAPGPVLVYSQFVDRGGIRPLTRYLQRAGFLAWGSMAQSAPVQGGAPPIEPQDAVYKKNFEDAQRLVTENGVFANSYTEDERQRILEITAREQPTPSPWYDPEAAVLPYRGGNAVAAATLCNLHHGQRKLFIGELEGLTDLMRAADMPRGSNLSRVPDQIKVVYAGAAPGHHMPYLARLFPTVEWYLYDPAPFRMRGSPAELSRIHMHQQYFTDDTAREWQDRCDIFISDIRINPPEDAPDADLLKQTGWSPTFEKQVALDMAMQDTWTMLIRPWLGASLKWRPPYVPAGIPHMIESMRGRILIQVWPSCSSTEGRLIVRGADAAPNTRMQFDAAHYQDACATRNVVDRPWGTYAAAGLDPGRVPGFDHCYDCAREAAAWRAYTELPARLTGPQLLAASTPGDVASLMNGLTAATGQRLDGGANKPIAQIIKEARETRQSRGTRIHGFHPELPAASRLALALSAAKKVVGGVDAAAAAQAPRYAVITGEVPTEERIKIVSVFNSPENSHGELIKAILVSKTGAEGLDLKWIRETHQLEPYWDRARDDQVRARAVRLGSHDGLPPAEREVQPYLYMAVANESIWKHMPSSSREPSTIDEQFYERASRRYQLNQAFRDVLTEACLECDLFGYSRSADGRRIVCRRCVPTNAALWLPDPAADARMPDSCELQTEQMIEAAPLVIDGQTIYYTADPDSSFGYSFFEERADLGAYAPVDPADPRLPKLLQLVLAV